MAIAADFMFKRMLRMILVVVIGFPLYILIWSIFNREPHILLKDDDFTKLIDLNNFDFLINRQSCDEMQPSPPRYLILIHSAPMNLNKRNVIRETWGNDDAAHRARVLFLLGAVQSDKLQQAIEKENYQYQDIIQGNYIDAYHNMTYKHTMALKWFNYFCPNAQYLLKTDDDIFVNSPMLYNLLDTGKMDRRNFIFCSEKEKSLIKRGPSKWQVSTKEYPGKYYPTYCSGWAILYSSDVVLKLYKIAQISPYFWIDDVHLTGTLRQALNLNVTSIYPYYVSKDELVKVKKHFNSTSFIYTSPYISEQEIQSFWNLISLSRS